LKVELDELLVTKSSELSKPYTPLQSAGSQSQLRGEPNDSVHFETATSIKKGKYNMNIPLFTNEKKDPNQMSCNLDLAQANLVSSLLIDPSQTIDILKDKLSTIFKKTLPKIQNAESLLLFLNENINKRLLYKHEPELKLIHILLKHLIQTHEKYDHLIGIQKVLMATVQSGDYIYSLKTLGELLDTIIEEKQQNISGLKTTRDVLILTFLVYACIQKDQGHFIFDIPETHLLKQKFIIAMIASSKKVNQRAVTLWVDKAFDQIKHYSKNQEFQIDLQAGYQSIVQLILQDKLQPFHIPFPGIKSVFGRLMGQHAAFQSYQQVSIKLKRC
jgi:hypothetical protein